MSKLSSNWTDRFKLVLDLNWFKLVLARNLQRVTFMNMWSEEIQAAWVLLTKQILEISNMILQQRILFTLKSFDF